MPMPLWWGQINKRVFNPLTLAQGKSPVLTHVGRASGRAFHTPLDAFPVAGGYLFILVYGSRSDWVRNILAAGSARLLVDGKEVELTAPRVVGRDEAFEALPTKSRRPVRVLRITEFLRMDLAAD
ncbi:nitroreductase family deazaflavin-dependent oxidoreductase [Nonomuraea fuscirosea]|jgi:deazaflavin-dependent oxidoreductase (nitroreductase family)|uniref:nitroreductase family deazaflavin-dependent oxidoreductase n=1 Tax=Nonomuraea fuscirosea TaxID=1291556 RepID=UPI002DD97979|nr:nitroreductase family deazaflavin-dependent oxidoreductase [Nonomuraea fuscirosea]WSA54956.1 nitroreductase family deazaflavin-dependent oxidoreductase [Nonomuraea fuscirosea]